MARNGKSNTFLLGRIYERTEQNSKILPVIQADISDMKEKLNKDHFRLTSLEKDVNKSIGFKLTRLISLILGK